MTPNYMAQSWVLTMKSVSGVLHKTRMHFIQVQPFVEVLFRPAECTGLKGLDHAWQIEFVHSEDFAGQVLLISQNNKVQQIFFLASTWGLIHARHVDIPWRN